MDQGSFRLRLTPEHATDAELSGLFRILEEIDSSERSSPDRGACAAAGIHNRGVLLVPDRSDENGGDGGAASEPPFRFNDHAQRARRAMLDAGFDL